jgi:hypothetical protein
MPFGIRKTKWEKTVELKKTDSDQRASECFQPAKDFANTHENIIRKTDLQSVQNENGGTMKSCTF